MSAYYTSKSQFTKDEKKDSKVGCFFYSLFGLAVSFFISVWLFNVGGYLFNSQKESTNNNILADLGGGLYLGAYESNLSTRYKFGNSDKAYGDVYYKTSEYTELFGMHFDEAEVRISTNALSSFSYMNNGGNGRLATIIVEKRGTTKELHEFTKQLIVNIRNQSGISGTNIKKGQFYRHYTLISNNAIVEMTYEGYLKHYIKVKVLAR